jgi:N-methylhydantoinase B
VSGAAARDDYGVVVGDVDATAQLRDERRAVRGKPGFFDRGPGYARLAQGERTGAG